MSRSRSYDAIHDVLASASGHWPEVFSALGFNVPDSPHKHVPCPACGGKDRFRFDDIDDKGTHICNQCGAGDGLELVKKVKNCNAKEAAAMVTTVLNIETAKAEIKPRSQKDIKTTLKRLSGNTEQKEPEYLTRKGLSGFLFPVLSDGKMLVVLRNESGEETAAQIIAPDGTKRLLSGSAKKGAYYAVNAIKKPETVIIAEGVATALSVHLLRPDALSIVAIDTGNLLPVAKIMRRKYPNSKVVIAADNDIQPEKKNIGKEKAEQAAVSVSGWVTLPPTTEKCDWDDYRQSHGTELAATAFNAGLYQPKETEHEPLKAHSVDELKPHIESRSDGVFWVTPKQDRETGEVIRTENWLCSAVEVLGTGRDDQERYLILKWTAEETGKDIIRAVPLADIGEREGWRFLKAGGVTVTTKNQLRAILADWLQRSGNGEIWHISQTSGWHHGAYIMPDGEILGQPEKPILFNGRSAAANGYSVQGTPQNWKENIARLAGGNPSMITAIAAALSAPLIGLVEADGFGLHFYELSSAGKTTTGSIASSLYGNPDLLRLTWYGTALGIANEAEAHNDGLLPLDEIGQGADPRAVSTSAYILFNGTGKIQSAKEGGNRELKRWRTVAISTGEVDIETYLSCAGVKVKAGQLVRLLNLPLQKASHFHEYQNGEAHADALKDACITHHGAAGRAWITYLATHQTEAREAVKAATARWKGLIPSGYGEQVHRVAKRFAILEAALMLGQVITGWTEQESRDAIQHSFNAWVHEFGTGNKEHEQIIAQCEAFLNAHGLSRFAPIPYDPSSLPIKDLAGYRQRGSLDSDPIMFYTFPAAFEKEIAQGFNVKQFAEVLKNAGMLKPPTSGRGYQRKSPRIDGRQLNVYVIKYQPEDDQPEE